MMRIMILLAASIPVSRPHAVAHGRTTEHDLAVLPLDSDRELAYRLGSVNLEDLRGGSDGVADEHRLGELVDPYS